MTYNYTIYIYSYRLSNRVGGGRGVTGGVGSRAIARGEPGERDHTQHCSEHTAITLHTLPRSDSTLLRAHSTLCNLICLLRKEHTVNTFYFAKITLNTAKIGCIDNGPKMAKIKIKLCYFTYVFRGIIQGIE